MLSDKLLKALNDQVTLEYDSAFIYRGMEVFFQDMGTTGFTNFFNKQAKEEVEHAEEFTEFILSVGGKVEIGGLNSPSTEYGSILEVYEAALKHEKVVTASITEILKIAIEEENFAAENFLRTFIDEQVEEEDTFQGLVDYLKWIGDDKSALIQFDKQMLEREE
jgi:ferritin